VTPAISADELYSFILANAEEIDGELVCRASLIAELRRRGVKYPGRLRKRLVKELTQRGLVVRPHPRSTWLYVFEPKDALPKTSGERFAERMSFGDEPGAIEITAFPNRPYACDREATVTRLSHLTDYMEANVLAGKRFVCSSWGECEGSISADCSFKEGQLSHIGKHYDLSREGDPLRIVVVGQEVGAKGKPPTTFAERYANVHDGSGMNKRFIKDGNHPSRNPHMKGTTLALRTILGTGSGVERQGEFINVNGEQVHLFDCFALVNRLLCAAHLTGTSTGMSTKTMLRNCERHFQATLEILEPTIVVLQGVRMWKWSKNVLVPKRTLSDNLIECSLAGKTTLVAAFSHPSSYGKKPIRWDSPDAPYFKEVVYPTLRRAVPL
jgi:hypothetical protein